MLFVLSIVATQASANEMDFEIGGVARGFNTAFVSVKICEPHTGTCRVIDKIKLDTGSTGLRIRSDALSGLHLPTLRTPAKEVITACMGMAGGVGYIGTLSRADINLGDEQASNATFQVVDPTMTVKGASCPSFPIDGRNGILGIGSLRSIPNGLHTYACLHGRCRAYLPLAGERAENIVAHLDRDNNGFIVRTPELSSPRNSQSGKIIFGLDTSANNRIASKLSRCSVAADGFMKLNYQGQPLFTMLDTGTFSTLLPFQQTTIEACKAGNGYLCPRSSTKFVSVSLLNVTGESCAKLNLPVRAYEPGTETQVRDHWALPDLATVNPLITNGFILGLPFFYGRDVYFVVEGQNTSLGRGPMVAF
jgi:hypothetical protein